MTPKTEVETSNFPLNATSDHFSLICCFRRKNTKIKQKQKNPNKGQLAAEQHISETREENGGRELGVVYEIKLNQ